MSKINVYNCSTSKENVGYGNCIGAIFENPDVVLLVDRNFRSTSTGVVTLSELKAATLATTKRIYPVKVKDLPTDDTPETEYVKSSFGYIDKGLEGIPDLTFEVLTKDIRYIKKLRTHNGSGEYVFFASKNRIFGHLDSGGFFAPIPASLIDVKPVKIQTGKQGSASTKYFMKVVLTAAEDLTDRLAFVDMDEDELIMDEVLPVKDVELTVDSETSTGVVKVLLKCPVSNENLVDTFGSEIIPATLADIWSFTKTSDGTAITPAAALSTYEDESCVAFTFNSSAGVDINLKSASALAAKEIGGYPNQGYESLGKVSVTITVA